MDWSRAIRRHHIDRLKKNRASYWAGSPKSPRALGKLAHTSTPCSCFMCGNRRKHDGPKRQEVIA